MLWKDYAFPGMKLVWLAIGCVALSVCVTLSSAEETTKKPEPHGCHCVETSKCPFMRFFRNMGRVFTLHYWKRHYYKIFHGKDIGACDPKNCKCDTEEDREACLKANHTCPCNEKREEKKQRWRKRRNDDEEKGATVIKRGKKNRESVFNNELRTLLHLAEVKT